MVLFSLYDIEKSYVNDRMPECWKAGKKLVWSRHFFQYSAASVRHQHFGISVQSGTSGPAMASYAVLSVYSLYCKKKDLTPRIFPANLMLV
jgi:hypothetical protein